MTPAPVLRAEALTVHLQERPAVSSVSFELTAPGLVALAGPNGAGKSTLLKALAGLLPLSSGHVSLDGVAIPSWSAAERARKIAYMPQDRVVHWDLPARRVVALGRLPHRRPGAAENDVDRAAIAKALKAVDAQHLADRPVLQLSGGERARILMARALAQEARVLLADEPAAGLDPAHQWSLFETLQRVATAGVRVIVAMHDLTLISRFATEVVVLADGRTMAHGAPALVLTPSRLADVYGIHVQTLPTTNGYSLLVPTGTTKPR
jgi:iron complex transport system ATP-binding protein